MDSLIQQVRGGHSDGSPAPPTTRRSASPPATYLCKVHQHINNSNPSPSTTHKTPATPHSLSAPTANHSLTGTPVRKVSASSFISSITQFYTGATIPPLATNVTDPLETGAASTQQQGCAVEGCNGGEESFPEIKGRVESKLMSMWHNVKYGKKFVIFYFIYTNTAI